jgi:glutaredoxin 3
MDITIYTLPICPNCDELKNALTLNNIKYKSENLEDPEVYAKLLLSQVTFTEAPITCIDGRFFDKQDALKELGLCLQ